MSGVNNPQVIIVHHDGVSRAGHSFDIINDYHRSRGFPVSSLGYYGGYHYLIERDGLLRVYRQEREIGAHTVGMNASSIGICLAGNMDIENVTEHQIATLGPLLCDIASRYGIDYQHIHPHRRYAQKTCYGSRLSDNWAAIVFLRHKLAVIEHLIEMHKRV